MIDEKFALLRTHRNNITRYCRLLKTKLTECERQFIERRLSEERSEMEKLALPRSLSRFKCRRSRSKRPHQRPYEAVAIGMPYKFTAFEVVLEKSGRKEMAVARVHDRWARHHARFRTQSVCCQILCCQALFQLLLAAPYQPGMPSP